MKHIAYKYMHTQEIMDKMTVVVVTAIAKDEKIIDSDRALHCNHLFNLNS